MKNKTRSLLFLLMALVVTLLGMAVGIYFNAPQPKAPIVLPQKTDGENIDMEEIRKENVRVVQAVKLDENNVLSLVSQFKRPLEYHFSTTNTVFSGDKSRVTTSEGFVKGTLSKVIRSENGAAKTHYVLTSNTLYMWENGSRSYEKLGKGSFSYDDVAFMPAYENLLKFEKVDSAKSFEKDGQMFIEVSIQRVESDIIETYVISVSTGLVSEVTFAEGQQVIAKTEVTLIGTDEIAESTFTLPDNSIPS